MNCCCGHMPVTPTCKHAALRKRRALHDDTAPERRTTRISSSDHCRRSCGSCRRRCSGHRGYRNRHGRATACNRFVLQCQRSSLAKLSALENILPANDNSSAPPDLSTNMLRRATLALALQLRTSYAVAMARATARAENFVFGGVKIPLAAAMDGSIGPSEPVCDSRSFTPCHRARRTRDFTLADRMTANAATAARRA